MNQRVNQVVNFDSFGNLDFIQKIDCEIKRLKTLVGVNCTTVFSHNDLQFGNIMKFHDSNRIIFLDYEYSGLNYLEYEFANFFCEWMADYNSDTPHSLDKTRYPSLQEQETFILHYLKSKDSKTQDDYKTELSDILKKIPIFTACSHLLWGLWGIIQSSKIYKTDQQELDFDYSTYGLNRLILYSEIKP